MDIARQDYESRILKLKAELKRARIMKRLQEIKDSGLPGPGRPRRVLPVTRDRVLELRSAGLSLRIIASRLTQEFGVYFSRSAVDDLLRSGQA